MHCHQARIQKKISGGAHHPYSPIYRPSPASEASFENFPYLAKNEGKKQEPKEAGDNLGCLANTEDGTLH